MGIHINGDNNSVHYGDNVHYGDIIYGTGYESSSKPPISFFGLLISVMVLIWVIVKFWWVVLIVVSVGAIAFGTWLERDEKRRLNAEAQRQAAALKARAERQNVAYLRGESWGVYGDFPPPPEVGL